MATNRKLEALIIIAIAIIIVILIINLIMKFVTGFPPLPPHIPANLQQVFEYYIFGGSPLVQLHVALGYTLIVLSAVIFALSFRRSTWMCCLAGIAIILTIGSAAIGANLLESGFDAQISAIGQMVDLLVSLLLYILLLRDVLQT